MSESILELYNNGDKIYEAPAFYAEGRPVIDMSLSEYEAESSHVAGAIYIIWEDE